MKHEMPLRVPPPKATSIVEQYVIDSLLHLDECLDDLRKAVKEYDKITREALTAFLEKIEEHQRFHDEMELVKDTTKAVWARQGRIVEKVIDLASAGGILAAIVYVAKFLGL